MDKRASAWRLETWSAGSAHSPSFISPKATSAPLVGNLGSQGLGAGGALGAVSSANSAATFLA